MSSTPSLIIGLDFGTTYSGVAFCDTSVGDSLNDIQVVQGWHGVGVMINAEKVPSRIAYQPSQDGNVETKILWGNLIKHNIKVPVHACMKLRFDEQQKSSLPFLSLMRILMSNFDDLDVNGLEGAMERQTGDGPPVYPGKDVVELVADYLTEVRKHAYKELTIQYDKGLFESMPRELVVTVPAVWSERAKDLTLKAVAKAKWMAAKTWLVTEPEAAAIYTLRDIIEGANKSEIGSGDTFVLCDAGGGTVDLISYKVTQTTPSFRVEEAAVGSGDKCGATYVEKEFLTWLEKWIGEERYNRIPKPKTRHGSPMINTFETAKMQFSGDDDDIPITLPSEIGIRDDDALKIEDGVLSLDRTQMRQFFDPCVNRTLELIDGQAVFVVGGFGLNNYLFQKIQEYCKSRSIQTRRPKHPWSAVARGAVCRGLEGKTSGLVAVRLARKFYGTPVSRLYNPDLHIEADAYIDEYTGRKMAKGQMVWLTEKGDRLPEDIPKTFEIQVSSHFTYLEEKEIGAQLCACTEDAAPRRYAHDDVKVICKVRANFSDIPVSRFPRMRNPKTGQEYYEVDFKLEARFVGGELTWRLLFEGKEWGSTTVSYDD
ncbi:actin-like ATPase domain-containing protein [Thozetella sp. PMI_491]|nr:actin-like ATPase domain-containing protein [Thozetella sp. PMI_491]